jgi:Rad3-related DNA helicase
LARCVVVVGLPYSNIQSATLKEKMDYLNKNTVFLGKQLKYLLGYFQATVASIPMKTRN